MDVLVHGIGDADVDAELIDIMKAKGTVYVPTLSVYEFKGGLERPLRLLDPEVQAALPPPSENRTPTPAGRERWEHLTGNVRKLFAAGIPVAVGTDAGMTGTFHGASTLRGVLDSQDTRVMLDSLARLGITVRHDAAANVSEVTGCAGRIPDNN